MKNDEISIKFDNIVNGDKDIEKYTQRLEKIYSLLSGIKEGQKSIQPIGKEIEKVAVKTDKVETNIKKAFSTATLGIFIKTLGVLSRKMTEMSQKSVNYVENINLLEVAYQNANEEIEESSARIEAFINKMAEVYGLDESNLARKLGVFKQMANAMQLPAETAENLSELMVKMTNDISSLYNLKFERSANALQSALAGQVRPIRTATGADITEKTLQNTVADLGLDRSIKQLSYAEKRLVMIISLTEQLKKSQGDYARTIESASNQIRILHEQWDRVSRALGNVFYPILEKILPYINAILMVLTEIFNLVASLLGFEMPDFDYSGLTAMDDATADLFDDMENVGESVDNLKNKLKGLRGFDKLNVISTPTSSASAGVGTGIDPKIMEAFNNSFSKYNDMMNEVNMKAKEIANSILDWLGFTDGTYTNLKLIAGILGTIVGLKLLKGVKTVFNLIKNSKLIATIAGVVKYLKNAVSGIKMFIEGTASLDTLMSGLVTPFMQMAGAIALIGGGIVKTFKSIKGLVKGTTDTFHGIIGIVEGIAVVVTGVAIALGGWTVALIAGAVALTAFITEWVVDNWNKIKEFFTNIWEGFNEYIISPVVEFFSSIAQFIYDNAISPIISFFAPIVDAIVSIFKTIVKNVEDIVVGIAKAVWEIIKKIGEIFAKIIEIFVALAKAFYTYIVKTIWDDFIVPFFKGLYNLVIKPIIDLFAKAGKWFFNNVITPIWDGFTWLWDKVVWLKDKIVGIFKTVGTTVVDFVGGCLKSVINGVLAGFEKLINTFVSMLNGAISVINVIPGVNITPLDKLSVPRLKVGMDFVPYDYFPAYLDYGERVLTKEENRDYVAQMQGINGNNKATSVNPTFIIQVGDEVIAKKVINDLQDMATTNGSPIVIGG